MEISIEILALLFAVSIVAGTVDTLAGGGGLITLPALMLSGVPPVSALGTNKLQGAVGTGAATFILLKKSKLKWGAVKRPVIAAFLGASFGTLCVQYINQKHLSVVIPIVLLFIACYFLFYTPKKRQNTGKKLGSKKYICIVIPFIGFYDGMFGPGTGSFFALVNIAFRKVSLIVATATAKPLNFSTNISSLMVFVVYGNVVWHLGLVMMLGQFIGAQLGVRLLYRVKPNHLRVLIIVVCMIMLINYLWNL